ncbi:HNH endonuclease signature motif containing protein [Varibaculum massiliense]|uniref:HNH endonuclease signature motif containing protein n=1 Tax=Varibaculum massiliense TaxID=1852372 RepID=UPI0009F3CD00|nr:HNH endonuclease signature motif containing protein [Varibaculum massiliense]
MNRKAIAENVKRRLWAESMGRCMNPDCRAELFIKNSDIMEKAHIGAYCETEDNSYENLIVLCPNCHKKFDKTGFIDENMVKQWKEIRRNELEKFFSVELSSFDQLKEKVVPFLSENYSIYKSYYLSGNKSLWDKFEPQILSNNEKLKLLFENNRTLFQQHSYKNYSNLELIQKFITHVDEFKITRDDGEKMREVLFPQEINSIFGIMPVSDYILPSTESMEELIKVLRKENLIDEVMLGIERPYILLKNKEKIFMDDTPRVRQLYYDNSCFRKTGVRLESLNFALKYLRSRNINFTYVNQDSLREIKVNDINIVFVYEYCLSRTFLSSMSPKPNYVIVNLHNWNGSCCISREALNLADNFEVKLLTMDEFYGYINEIK